MKIQEAAAAVVGDRMYVVGGYDSARNSSSSVFVYDGSTWQRGPALPIAVNHPGAAAIGGDVYVVGGFTPNGATNRAFVLPAGSASLARDPRVGCGARRAVSRRSGWTSVCDRRARRLRADRGDRDLPTRRKRVGRDHRHARAPESSRRLPRRWVDLCRGWAHPGFQRRRRLSRSGHGDVGAPGHAADRHLGSRGRDLGRCDRRRRRRACGRDEHRRGDPRAAQRGVGRRPDARSAPRHCVRAVPRTPLDVRWCHRSRIPSRRHLHLARRVRRCSTRHPRQCHRGRSAGSSRSQCRPERREWDSNPRRLAPHTLSKRADSAALASLPGNRDARREPPSPSEGARARGEDEAQRGIRNGRRGGGAPAPSKARPPLKSWETTERQRSRPQGRRSASDQ